MSIDDEFIDRVFDGDMSEEEAAEFQKWLKVPAHLERYALRGELHAQLRRSLRRRHIQSSVSEPSLSAPVPADYRTTVVSRPKVFLLTVTGLVTAACIVFAFLSRRYDGDGVPGQGDLVLATIVSDVSGLLTRGGQQWNDTYLSLGEYELQRGLLHLQFEGGVMVYVEAPTRFDTASNSRVVLHSGRLSARVPPEGIGFTVETPEAEVVDFGTEFSVDVGDGASEVHVFDGLVRVNPGATNKRDESKSVDVQASQAVRISDGTADPEDISIATDRFIRNFDEPKRRYARSIKRLLPVAYYRMAIRDRGLVSEPPEYSGVVLTGEGKRPPHASGVFAGGSLRSGVDSSGRGGRVDAPPTINTGRFSLTLFVYRESELNSTTAVTNLSEQRGNFKLALNENGKLQGTIKSRDGSKTTVEGGAVLPLNDWRHVVLTINGDNVQLYEDGRLVASRSCAALAASESEALWFGTDASAKHVWDGRIDEVALFDRALNEEEVVSLYRVAQEEIFKSK